MLVEYSEFYKKIFFEILSVMISGLNRVIFYNVIEGVLRYKIGCYYMIKHMYFIVDHVSNKSRRQRTIYCRCISKCLREDKYGYVSSNITWMEGKISSLFISILSSYILKTIYIAEKVETARFVQTS